jgi:hypothetical protein
VLHEEFSRAGRVTDAKVREAGCCFTHACSLAAAETRPTGAAAAGCACFVAWARAQVITFRDVPSKSRGFGFVVYDTAADAAQAVTQLNGHVLSGRALSVTIAEPREPRFPRQQHGHGGGDSGAHCSAHADTRTTAALTLSAARVFPTTASAGFRQRVFPRHLGAWGVPMPGRACLLAPPAPVGSPHGVRAHSTATGVAAQCYRTGGAQLGTLRLARTLLAALRRA